MLVSGLMFGGGQRVVADLLETAGKTDFAKLRVCLLGKTIKLFDSFDPVVVRYDGRYNSLTTLWPTAQRLRRALLEDPPAILHTHGWDADIIGWLAIRRTGIRHIVHLHVMPEWLRSGRVKHCIRRLITRLAFSRSHTQVVAVSAAVRRFWADFLPFRCDAIRVICNGIDVNRFRPDDRSSRTADGIPVIGVAARLAPAKGVEYLLDALGMLARQGFMFNLKLAGAGVHLEELEERAQAAGIAGCTEFMGHVDDIQAFYRGLDVFVLPSLSEGMPLTILEAMSSQVAIVATSIAGIPEAVRNGVEGFLVPPADTLALASALRKLLTDEALRKRMGQQGRSRAMKEFSLERVCGEVTSVYQDVLESGGLHSR